MEKIVNVFTSTYAHKSIDFDEVTCRGHQFTAKYLNGETSWNHEHQIADYWILVKYFGKLNVIQNIYSTTKSIYWSGVHNLQGCKLRSVMCRFVSNRKYRKSTPINNIDLCYMDLYTTQ